MAFLRWLFRKRKYVYVALVAFTFWMIFIFLSLPTDQERKRVRTGLMQSRNTKSNVSLSRKYFEELVETKKSHIPIKIEKTNASDASHANTTTIHKLSLSNTTVHLNSRKSNNSGADSGAGGVLEKIKSKTLEVKNKTLQKLSEFGVINIEVPPAKLLKEDRVWNLNLSVEDIGNLMKDTAFMNKLTPVDKQFKLSGDKNVTYHKGGNSSHYLGYCHCFDKDCMCCARLFQKRIKLNKTVCSNFTFISKTQELDFKFLMDKRVIYNKTIQAHPPPQICLGSYSKVVDLCISFTDMDFKVTPHEDHKTQLLGCVTFSLNLFNKSLSAIPVNCFQIPSERHSDSQLKALGNWVP